MTELNQSKLDASSLDAVDQILREITAERQKLGDDDEPQTRESLISKAKDLIATLETPYEAFLELTWLEPARAMASRVAVDLKIFETLIADGGRTKSLDELAAPTGASCALVDRIARVLSVTRMIKEVGPSKYAPNRFTYALSNPGLLGGIRFGYDVTRLSFQAMPEYLKMTHYQSPENPLDGPWQFATKPGHSFEWLNEYPELLQAFHADLNAAQANRPNWWDEGFYPVDERLVNGLEFEGDSSVLIDLGGGTGQTLDEIRVHVPAYKGRLVLQDQASVIKTTRTLRPHERIELQVHDFFTEQPIKGARAYHLRYILHDWNDESCKKILTRLKDAMRSGYSKILICDFVLANQTADWRGVSCDVHMMALHASHERTEADWTRLADSVGLKIQGIWTKGLGNESLIELTL